ncbi:amidase [Melanomma pulvis-pyrius CBS 109.77]|uniref:amidase n=1 Tax=Melanomma pulvis-pyrius CBS 109.77 TaxID=1314802 RepID=A0A6A6X8G6_9PLEO|nr:amidase [Melanomma pulvis-pyrius CBS 109.77]
MTTTSPLTSSATATVESWQTKVAAKQKSCFEKIPKEWLLSTSIMDLLQTPLSSTPNRLIQMDIPRKSGIMSERELDVTEKYTVGELLEGLRTGKMTSLEVTIAFSKRAAIAQQLTSCLTETYFSEAQERARYLDSEFAAGRIVGPLHGLPISLKDGFHILGSQATLGFVSFLDRVSDKDSPLVEMLRRLGAVTYVKTNIPQTLMTGDSENNIFGRTLIPHNTALTAGGSSGGEGALVAFRGSPLGIGTDVAGSIRIPSLCCGTYGFKPTASRVPYGGQASPGRSGMSFFLASAGPIANDIDALSILTRSVLDARPAMFDSSTLDIPWRQLPKATTPRLKLGLLSEDPVFPFHPPVKRALAEAARLLTAQGHEIIPIPAAEAHVADALELAFNFFGLDGTSMAHIEASGEPIIPSILHILSISAKSTPRFCADLAGLEGVEKIAALNVKRSSLTEDWRRIWGKYGGGLDGVVCAAAQHTAVQHDTYGIPPYTLFLNVLDYPACIIPFGTASSELDPEPMVMGSGQIGPDYDPSAVAGAPTSIQVFTNKMRDEECLQIAGIIDSCLRGV